MTTEEVASRCERSVGLVSGPSGFGTGFLVADGLMATNAHVINDIPPDQIRVTFPAAEALDRGPMVGQVVYFDPKRDLAILRISTRIPPLQTATDHKFRRGQDVVVIGNPGIGEGKFTETLECVVSRGVIGSKVVEDGLPFYQLSGSINAGNSGGPIIDTTGQVVGVVTLKARKEEGLGFCIPAEDLSRAIRTVTTQPSGAAQLAARRQAEGADAEAAQSARITEAMNRTDPATWIAMMDTNRILTDQSPEARQIRGVFDQADRLYADSRRDLALAVVNLAISLKENGTRTSGFEILQGSISWAPSEYFRTQPPVKFVEYAKLYEIARVETKNHPDALASLRRYYREATSSVPQSNPGSGLDSAPERVAAAPQRLPSTSAAAEMLRLAQSLDSQRKSRGALHYYLDLVDDFPGTAEAAAAAQRIKTILPPPSFGNRRPAPILDVFDGMTILVNQDGARTQVRLLGLDSLPSVRTTGKNGPWEDQTKAFLKNLLAGRSVFLEFERGVNHFDDQGRSLAYVHRADDKLDINWEMIIRGYGVASRYASLTRAEDYRDAGLRAKSRKVGLWQP